MSQAPRQPDSTHGWCSLRLRFEQRELTLLKGAEHVRGAALAHTPRPDVLRSALNLAKAGHKLAHAGPGAAVSLEEGELKLLVEAVRFASAEVQWVGRSRADVEVARREAILTGFPELVERGAWRSFGLIRELDTLATRLSAALSS